ncbi:S26 family signal peptidase [Pelagerythrobacter marinus]|uniref:S26 family signal peptidase n=1 Tax=Pelagerythrobacter marinus TaxID=538382 RepID=UPI002036E51E|nr:S26 family signal peptidase [Pelagerythrobacter marinus]USA38895.1 S26 family signal peptidase [Pelagerythrobacter marinus]WPZ07025.1 S26 family signal peptidase [Pelagerythrobacter marinus]
MKRGTVLVAGTAAAAALLSVVVPLSRAFVWNVTASVPTGLYHIGDAAGLHVGERVALDPPHRLRDYLARRGYLPAGVPLMKEVAALPGDTVCRNGLAITINASPAASARARDRTGRALPVWDGCRTIAAHEIFVMNPRAPGSFDGRYFGPLARHRVIGRARPVWTDEAGDGDHVWFARFPRNSQPHRQ